MSLCLANMMGVIFFQRQGTLLATAVCSGSKHPPVLDFESVGITQWEDLTNV